MNYLKLLVLFVASLNLAHAAAEFSAENMYKTKDGSLVVERPQFLDSNNVKFFYSADYTTAMFLCRVLGRDYLVAHSERTDRGEKLFSKNSIKFSSVRGEMMKYKNKKTYVIQKLICSPSKTNSRLQLSPAEESQIKRGARDWAIFLGL